MSNIPSLSSLHYEAFNSLGRMATFPGDQIKQLSQEQNEKLERLDKATENSLVIIHGGLRGIGRMMITMAEECDNKDSDLSDTFSRMSRLTMMDIGSLVNELSETADCLTHQKNEIEYIKRQQAKI